MRSHVGKNSRGCQCLIQGVTAALMGLVVLISAKNAGAEADTLVAQIQISPMRQDSINKMPPITDIPRAPITAADAPSSGTATQEMAQPLASEGEVVAGYDPSGRRDPFAPIIHELQAGKVDENLPPLQRVTLTELNLIAIVWGAHGYTAMVQTPEGNGYTVRRGTRVGQHNGVVSAVTDRGIIVQEQFTDVYGKKQEREYVKLLHPKEGSE
jgi:type IV pilus assembly protein PilP